MMKNDPLPRRDWMKTVATGAALATGAPLLGASHGSHPKASKLKGNIHHSVCKWCYKDIPLDAFCAEASAMGIVGVDLLRLSDTPTLRKYGLTNAIVSGVPGGIKSGLNRVENHEAIIAFFEETIPLAAKEGFPNIICFSGNREGMSDQEGWKHCATGLKQITPLAEKHGVTIAMELLNSKRNHKDYMCDFTPWGVELCNRVGSDRFKLLYDIYHMQIMEGDVIATIREFHPYFAHYHTGGVPGRHEIDKTQELYYPAIMEAILETGYTGYVAQEFIPSKDRDPMTSLREAIHICDV